MVKKQTNEEPVDFFEPTREEIYALKDALQKFPQERINGKMQPSIDRYAESKGIIRFNEFGETVVRKPREYLDLMAVNEKVRGIQWAETERIYQQFPEEREKARATFREMISQFKLKTFGKL